MATEPNRIVDAATDKVSIFEGAGLVQDVVELSASVANGQWAGSLVGLLSAGLEVRDALQDPMAKLISVGLGWAIEFFGPLNTWLDWLTVDQEQLTVAAETWSGISAELRTAAQKLDEYYKKDTAHWSGAAVDQYRVFCADRVDLYTAAGAAAVTANLINGNKVLLTVVRSIVRDLITDAVGKVISIVLRYPPPSTLAASGEIAAQVQSTGNAIVDLIRKLHAALKNAWSMLRKSGNIFGEIRGQLQSMRESLSVVAQGSKDANRLMSAYNRQVDALIGGAVDVGKYAVTRAGKDALRGFGEQVGMELLKEPTKYRAGRVDESAPTHPAVEQDGGER